MAVAADQLVGSSALFHKSNDLIVVAVPVRVEQGAVVALVAEASRAVVAKCVS